MKFLTPFIFAGTAMYTFSACEKSPTEKAAEAQADALEQKAKEVKSDAEKTSKAIKEEANAKVDAVKENAKAEAKATEQVGDAAAKTLKKRADEVRDAAKDNTTPSPALDSAPPTRPMETPVP